MVSRTKNGAVRTVLSAVALLFLGRYLIRNGSQIPPLDWHRSAPALLIGLASFTLLRLCSALLWGRILAALGVEMSPGGAVRIHTRALLARYIPGNVWHAVSITAWCAQEGIAPGIVVTAWLLENAYTVLGAAFAALAALPVRQFGTVQVSIWSIGGVFAVGLLVVHPRVLRGLLRAAARLLRKTPAAEIPLSYPQSLRFVLLYAVVFVGQGLTFYGLMTAMQPHPPSPFAVVGIFSAAWVVGYLSFLTPSGLGVREAVMTVLLSRVMPSGDAALLPLILRLLMTAAELAAAALPFGREAHSAAVGRARSLKTDIQENISG